MTALQPISLAAIRSHRPCEDGWTKLLRSLGCPPESAWETTFVTLGDIAASNGAADAWWCVRALPDEARRDVIRALLSSVRRVTKNHPDRRVNQCVSTVANWVAGRAMEDDLRAAARAANTAWTAAAAWAAAEADVEAAATAEAAAAAWAVARAAWAVAAKADAAPYIAALVNGMPTKEREAQVADIIAVFERMHTT